MINIQKKFDWLFIGTLAFFSLGIVHIIFSWLGLICMVTPFIMAARSGKRPWCTTPYCPRAHFFNRFLNRYSLKKKAPEGLFSEKTKQLVLRLFCINLFFAGMSTLMVYLGRLEPMIYLRFLMAFPMPFDLPQLLELNLPQFLVHASYRLYSIMLTSTIIGVGLGLIFKPRTWCGICPIQTLTTVKNRR
ncbi:MAG: 4Fe-4S binding protein [Clostridia bacterium]|nr:4Fe-4S binding protein [Clostridia bacterium]